MNKSQCYEAAMVAVMGCDRFNVGQKLEVLELLMEDRKLALWSEKLEAEKQEAEKDAALS